MNSTNGTDDKKSQREQAEAVVKRDTPTTKPSSADSSTQEPNEQPQVYRPDANVDNQKGSHPNPHHGSDYDEKEFSGWQAGDKQDQKDNINEKAQKASNSRRQG
ncbi:hypothetical protein R5M92_06105 [Halomonas sp. Bachu 37]|uniref:hypothetical protein n=1 Tax=Halomonas kashgarensis TaxID=3084920 RepID=UPI00321623FD